MYFSEKRIYSIFGVLQLIYFLFFNGFYNYFFLIGALVVQPISESVRIHLIHFLIVIQQDDYSNILIFK